jgi:primosomal protein N' (replication factor Y)
VHAQPGARVRVPFGRRQLVGILVRHVGSSDLPPELREVTAVIDAVPLLGAADLQLLEWATEYYHHPVGEVFATALPRLLREGRGPGAPQPVWSITADGVAALQEKALQRAPKQELLLEVLAAESPRDEDTLDAECAGWRTLVRKLAEKGWVQMALHSAPTIAESAPISAREAAPTLTAAQETAVQALRQGDGHANFLLDGVAARCW